MPLKHKIANFRRWPSRQHYLSLRPFWILEWIAFGTVCAVDLGVNKKHAITTHKNYTVLSVDSVGCNVPSRFLNAQPLWIVEWMVDGVNSMKDGTVYGMRVNGRAYDLWDGL